MKKEPRWISKQSALAIHEALLAAHGGRPGLRDEGLLESALAAPLNLLHYHDPDLFGLAAAYAHALTRNHPFQDGNKRLAFTVAGVFLERNGFRLEAREAEAVQAVVALSARGMTEEGFASWLRNSSRKLPRQRKPAGGRSPRRRAR